MEKIKRYSKIGIIIFLSVVVTKSVSIVFVNDTPKIRENALAYVMESAKTKRDQVLASLPFGNLFDKSIIPNAVAEKEVDAIKEALINAPIKAISKGAYAQTNGEVTMTTYNTGEMDMVEYNFLIDGKTITIMIPASLAGKPGFTEAEIRELVEQGM